MPATIQTYRGLSLLAGGDTGCERIMAALRGLADRIFGPTVTKTSAYAITEADRNVRVDATGGSVTLTLPDATTAYQPVHVKPVGTSTNLIVVQRAGATAVIDPSPGPSLIALSLTAPVTFWSDGTNWHTIVHGGAAGALGVFPVAAFGAKVDGTTDDLAFVQSAFNAADAAGGGMVLVTGVCGVKPTAAGYLLAKSKVRIQAAYPGCGFKVLSSTGNFKSVISQGGSAISNFEVVGLTFDMNPSGNTGVPVVGSANTEQYAIYLPNASGVRVTGCRFEPCTGINTVVVTGSHAEVTGNYFNFVPKTSPASYDNSAVYLLGPNYTLHGNTFEAAVGSGARGAVELHRGGGNMTGNTVDGFQTMVNIVGDDATVTSNSHVIVGNTGRRLNYGITLWPVTAKTLRDVVTSGNTLEIAQTQHYATLAAGSKYAHGIAVVWDATCQGSVESWTCVGNTIVFDDEGAGNSNNPEYLAAGIRLLGQGTTSNVVCIGNTVTRPPGPGIRLSGSIAGSSISRARVANNIVSDAGQNAGITNGAFRTAFSLEGTMTDVVVENNSVVDTGAVALKGVNLAIYYAGAGTLTNVRYRNNTVSTVSGLELPASINVAGITGGDGIESVAYAASYTPKANQAGRTKAMTLTGACSVNAIPSSSRVRGEDITLVFTQDGTGGRVASFNSFYKVNTWRQGLAPNSVSSITFRIADDAASAWQVGGGGPVRHGSTKAGGFLVSKGAPSTTAFANGVLSLAPVDLESPRSITALAVEIVTTIGSAGALLRLGVYAEDDNGMPSILMVDASTIAADDATGMHSITLGSPLVLPAGRFWLASVCQGTPATVPVRRITSAISDQYVGGSQLGSSNSQVGGYSQAGVTGALPATLTSVASTTSCDRVVATLA